MERTEGLISQINTGKEIGRRKGGDVEKLTAEIGESLLGKVHQGPEVLRLVLSAKRNSE